MRDANKVIEDMIREGECIENTYSVLVNEIRSRMCNEYCKYPEEYSARLSEEATQRMLSEKCVICPLNFL